MRIIMWCAVLFLEEYRTAVVPKNWIFKDAKNIKCWWPPYQTDNKINAAVSNCEEPVIAYSDKPLWISYSIKMLGRLEGYDSLIRARQKCRRATDNSEYDSVNSSAMDNRKLMAKRKTYNMSSEEECNNDPTRLSSQLPKLPSPPKEPLSQKTLLPKNSSVHTEPKSDGSVPVINEQNDSHQECLRTSYYEDDDISIFGGSISSTSDSPARFKHSIEHNPSPIAAVTDNFSEGCVPKHKALESTKAKVVKQMHTDNRLLPANSKRLESTKSKVVKHTHTDNRMLPANSKKLESTKAEVVKHTHTDNRSNPKRLESTKAKVVKHTHTDNRLSPTNPKRLAESTNAKVVKRSHIDHRLSPAKRKRLESTTDVNHSHIDRRLSPERNILESSSGEEHSQSSHTLSIASRSRFESTPVEGSTRRHLFPHQSKQIQNKQPKRRLFSEELRGKLNSPGNNFQEVMKYALVKIATEIERQGEMLSLVVSLLNNNPVGLVENDQTMPDFGPFPLETQEQLEEVENKLKHDKQYKLQLIKLMSKIGGSTTNEATKRILRRMMTDKVAAHYSWVGKKKKRVFSALHLKDILFAAVRTNGTIGKNSTEFAIENAVKDWLRHAPYRAMAGKNNHADDEIGDSA